MQPFKYNPKLSTKLKLNNKDLNLLIWNPMKRFLKKILFFSIIPLLYLIPAIYIDPFNIIHKENNPTLIKLESQISAKLNRPLYKLQKYSEQPTDLILLGDSRTDMLKSSIFEKLTGIKSTNLAYGGGSLLEIIETFWYVTKIHDIKQVYIGINFSLYNEYYNRNRVTEAIMLKSSPLAYLFSEYCYKSLFLITKSLITKKNSNIGVPSLNKEEFWKFQLDSSASKHYRFYKYPKSYQKSLIEISTYCTANNIKLVFFIPPTHIDLQQKVKEFSLETEEKIFKTFLANLGTTYDFDYPSDITRNYNYFNDPYHSNDSISEIVIKAIVTDKKKSLN